jgi:hypothetical protein
LHHSTAAGGDGKISVAGGRPERHAERKPLAGIGKRKEPFMQEFADEIDLRCPLIVARNAAHGLELRARFGRGGTEIGVARARDLKNRANLSPHTIKRMVSFFARHEVDKRAKNFGNEENPSAGYVAWLLWGGDEGRAWAIEMKKRIGNAPDI